MKNLITRALTGILFVAAIVGAMHIPLLFWGLMALFLAIMMREYYILLIAHHNCNPQMITGIVLGLISMCITVGVFAFHISPYFYISIIPLLLLMQVFELFRTRERPLSNIAHTLFGLFYLAMPFSVLVILAYQKGGEYNKLFLLYLFCALWAFDTGAYLVGMTFGKHSLFARWSPKKTWEGAIGGFIFCVLVGYIFSFYSNYSFLFWLGASTTVAIMGTFGDLMESMIKRSLDVKDSGKSLPGHGGFLDRLDSLLFAAPALLFYITLFNHCNL